MKSTDIKNHKTSISQTHNLEVPGSSPGWSTFLLQRLTLRRRPLFFFVSAKTMGKVSFLLPVKELLIYFSLHSNAFYTFSRYLTFI